MATRFRHLLLATEHTEFDAGSEALALALAQRCALPLACVLPVLSNQEFEAQAPALAARADALAHAHLDAIAQAAAAQGVTLAARSRHGAEPYQEIVDEARERGTDLLIIRRRGQRSFLARLLLGEMVSKVVAHAPCHVLIVAREAKLWSRRVLVAAEPGAQGERTVTLACDVAAECGLPLTIVCVRTSASAPDRAAQDFVQQRAEFARAQGVQAEGVVLEGQPVERILQAVRDHGADLLVIGSRSAGHGTSHVWIGGVTQKVTGLSDQAVLLAHSDESHTKS